jgi:hypothetical protein
MRARLVVLVALMCTTSCRGSFAGPTASDAGSALVPGFPVEAAAIVPNQLATNAASPSWRGSYKSVPGTLFVPADWKNVHWNVAPSSWGLGNGTMRLTVDPAGRIRGLLEGPLGPAVVDGFDADGSLTATVQSEHPEDQGFAGTLLGKVVDGRVEGTMHVSSALADAIRTATFVLGADGAPDR